MGFLKSSDGARRNGGVRRSGGAAAALALAALAFLSCERKFDSPFLPDNGDYAGSDWGQDRDGNGVADSVEKYAPGCRQGPEACLRQAQAAANIGGNGNNPDTTAVAKKGIDSVVAEDLSLTEGGDAVPPRFHCYPQGLSAVGYTLLTGDPAVAAVAGEKIRPVAQGNTSVTLTATGPDGGAKTTVFRVTVTRGKVFVSSIRADDMAMTAGEEKAAAITVAPADADDRRVQLVSDDPAVADTRGGVVIAVAKGSARITVKALDAGGAQTSFKVKVTAKLIDLDGDDMELNLGAAPMAPHLIFTPPEAATDDYLLTGGFAGIAEVTPDGKSVAAEGPGLAFFSVSVGGFVYDIFSAHVSAPPPKAVQVLSVRVKDMEFALTKGPLPRQLPQVTWDPPDATDKSYTLTSDNALVALVVGDAVEAALPGETKVTLATHDGNKLATFRVRVKAAEGHGKGNGSQGKAKGKDKGGDQEA
jgi:hypothetical protein